MAWRAREGDQPHAVREAGRAVILVDLDERDELSVGRVLHAQHIHRRESGAQAERHRRAFVPVECQTHFVKFVIRIHNVSP